jgi:hypothetical protein
MNTLAVREPDIFTIGHGVKLSLVGMTLPDSIDEDQWNEIGDQVMRLDNASNWMLGDWWAHGMQSYGERKKWLAEQKAKRSKVKSFGHLAACASVCRSFETLRRRKVVSFEMHRELLGLSEAKQDKFLDLIEAGEIRTHKELREKVKPARKVKPKAIAPLQIKNHDGRLVQINNPLPTWHVMNAPGYQQFLGCTACWTVSQAGYSGGSLAKMTAVNLEKPEFMCECEDSTRPATFVK